MALTSRFIICCRSESVGQSYLFVVAWLYSLLKANPSLDPSKMFLCYDNMCNLDKTKFSKQPLPLPPPFNTMWLNLNKVIDEFHLKNHIDPKCKILYNPKAIEDMYPEIGKTKNSQACEQTFSWLGRYKKILCPMTKTHHIFYLNRIVKRRNAYTTQCYQQKKTASAARRNTKNCWDAQINVFSPLNLSLNKLLNSISNLNSICDNNIGNFIILYSANFKFSFFWLLCAFYLTICNCTLFMLCLVY